MSLFAILAAAAQASTALSAPPLDQVGFDIRCMAVAQLAVEEVDGAMKASMQLAALYYFGRVDAALSEPELERRFEEQARAIEGQPLGPILAECGTFMEMRAKRVEDIGARMSAREQARQTH